MGLLRGVSSSRNTLTINHTLQVQAGRYVERILTLLRNTLGFNGNQEVLDDNWASITSVTGGTTSLGFTLSRGYVLTLSEDYTGDVLISGTLATNTVSPALKQAAMSLVLYYIKNQYLKSISNGVDSVSLADYASVPVHIKSILDLYRLV